MRKFVLAFLALVLLATLAYAQVVRNAPYNITGKTNFTNVGVQGVNTTGNPGFIELRGVTNITSSTDANETFYLWVSGTGDLCIASRTTLDSYSSFPNGSWQINSTSTFPCTVVGNQS